jgi:predicted hydrocarbon binding protein/KaiC/GvpD/RAD55 family RecA-like ATPase
MSIMGKGGLPIIALQEMPRDTLTLLVGPPGAGKSTFCHEIVVDSLAREKPVIFITTEQSPSAILALLQEKGMGERDPGTLCFVDAFAKTVGLATQESPDTLNANCVDLNSISMATTKLHETIGEKEIVLVFDSLTSPYLFCGVEIIKFMRLFLTRFAAEGNSVLALMDEGCGKEEDLGAMMSASDGIFRMEIKEKKRIVNIVKHPTVAPTRIETPVTESPTSVREMFDERVARGEIKAIFSALKKPLRTQVQDDFVHVFWRNLACWSGMLWDPKRFPAMAYELDKEAHARSRQFISLLPWYMKLMYKLFTPESLSEVKDMKRLMSRMSKSLNRHGYGVVQYLEDKSKKDEHYFSVHECCSCWGFDNVGAGLGFHACGESAGGFMMTEKVERDWNIVETKCIGLGDNYCEFKIVPGHIDELKSYLEKIDSTVVARVHDRLMEHLMGFLVQGKPLPGRPVSGDTIFFEEMHHVTGVPALLSERYRVALRMGGVRAGKEVGEHLTEAGVTNDEAIKRVIDFMEYCKIGKVELGETIRMWDNCESFGLETGHPSCNFTTGFLNGLFSTVKKQHVREIKCIAAGDPFCEWEII